MNIPDDCCPCMLVRALTYAERMCRDHARTLTQCAESGGNGMISPDAATQMAESYQQQANEFQGMRIDIENTI
jgi:tryptophan synthase alpha subunit